MLPWLACFKTKLIKHKHFAPEPWQALHMSTAPEEVKAEKEAAAFAQQLPRPTFSRCVCARVRVLVCVVGGIKINKGHNRKVR